MNTCFHCGLFSSAFSIKSPKLLSEALKGNLGWTIGRQCFHLMQEWSKTALTSVKSTQHIVQHPLSWLGGNMGQGGRDATSTTYFFQSWLLDCYTYIC